MNLPEKIAALIEGDEFIFGEILKEYHPRVYFYVLSKTQSAYLAEEVTQLTFIKLWNNRQRLDRTLSVSAQVFRIAKTTCIDLLRQEGNRHKLLHRETSVQHTDNVSETLDVNDLRVELAQELKKMPPVRKMVFELSRNESKSHKEIARILSISEKTVESHIYLAIKHLRKAFGSLFLLTILFFSLA